MLHKIALCIGYVTSEYKYDVSNIGQFDGNDTIASDSISSVSDTNVPNKSSNYFRILEHNVNSLKGKKEDLNELIEVYKPDCLILVETKLNATYKTSEFFDPNTWNVAIREDRNEYGGGIIIAVLRKFIVSPIKIVYENDE